MASNSDGDSKHQQGAEVDEDAVPVTPRVTKYRTSIQCHPFDKSWLLHIFSLITFSWLGPTMQQGSKRQLDTEDMYALPSFDTAERCVSRLENMWDPKKKRSFWVACCLSEYAGLIFAGFIFVSESTVQVVGAYLLGQLTRVLEREEAGEAISDRTTYLYALGISLCALMNGTFHHICFFLAQRAGHCLRTATIALVYKKALKLSTKGAHDVTVGHMTNLVSNDVERFFLALPYIHFIWIGPVQTIVVAVLLWDLVGAYALCGIGLIVLLIPVNTITSRMYARFREKTAKQTDRRVRIMSEILGGMRVIKMYVWEKPFARLIAAIRGKELDKVKKTQILKGTNLGFFFFSSSLITFLTLVPFAATGHKLTAYRVFTSIALFDTVRLTMTLFFPFGIQYFSEMRVSCARIERFLRLPEHVPPDDASTAALPVGSIRLQHATFSWNDGNMGGSRDDGDDSDEKGKGTGGSSSNGKVDVLHAQQDEQQQKKNNNNNNNNKKQQAMNGDKPVPAGNNTLTDVTLDIKPGMLVGVVGPVGSGKTTLLMGMLRELLPSKGSAGVRGRVSYASQEPWILATTVRENILFGAADDPARRAAVIRACALERDLQLLPGGEQALIGERGVTLSGGQKARVSLARAVYRQADVYLLDDPLSAVDAKVGRVLFEECICGLLAGKTRVLATHQVHHLAKADLVVVLDANGRVAAQGVYSDLLAQKCEALMSELEAAQEDDDNNNDDDDDEDEDDDKDEEDAADGKGETSNVRSRAQSESKSRSRQVSESGGEGADESAESTDSNANALFKQEDRFAGQVTWSTYTTYFKHMGSTLFIIALLLSVPVVQALYIGVDLFLANWVDLEDSERNSSRQVGIYCGLLAALATGAMLRAIMFQLGFVEASRRLHDNMFAAVIASPIRFFDTNPVGRILNRFSKDTGYLDDILPPTYLDFIQLIGIILGTIILASAINPWVLLAAGPILVIFVLIRGYFLRTAREIKRLEAICRSPIYSHFSTSLAGLATIRSQGGGERAVHLLHNYQNTHAAAVYMFLAVSRWLGFRLDFLSFAFITVVVFAGAALRDTLAPGFIALSLAYALRLTGAFQWCVRQSAEVENYMTSVERAIEYTKLKPETDALQRHDDVDVDDDERAELLAIVSSKAGDATNSGRRRRHASTRSDGDDGDDELELPEGWPSVGGIVLSNMSMRYAEELPPALRHLSMVIPPAAKVGIVGRTGAGKSSILAALFRLSIVEGTINIDGVDVTKLPLSHVRRKISVIPQDPTLFSGTVRYNLDPFEQYSDADLWAALETVQLKEKVQQMDGGLEGHVQEQGSNFSVGQKQLICLARALLKRNKILVIDEATAHVDDATDRLIQHTLRREFKDCTVLTIAHRLHTIMDSDMIAVMDAGRLVEYDQPYALLQRSNSHLSRLVASVEADSHAALVNAAKRHHSIAIHDTPTATSIV